METKTIESRTPSACDTAQEYVRDRIGLIKRRGGNSQKRQTNKRGLSTQVPERKNGEMDIGKKKRVTHLYIY